MMDELLPHEYTIVIPLLHKVWINAPMIHTMLEKRSGGKVFTDRANPSFALVYNPSCYTFLAGDLNEDALKKVALYLKGMSKVSLACPVDWKYRPFFEKEGFVAVDRMQFRRPKSQIQSRKKELPVAYQICKIGKKNFSRCQWYEFVSQYYDSEEQFLSYGMGFCVVDRSGKVLSESYGLISSTMAEIVVATDPDHQGKGLGTFACDRVLNDCLAKSLEVVWSCDQSNLASAGIAKKLGFEKDRPYLFLKWIS
jgi:GNAT superfamily N-acetyltransferase